MHHVTPPHDTYNILVVLGTMLWLNLKRKEEHKWETISNKTLHFKTTRQGIVLQTIDDTSRPVAIAYPFGKVQ